MLSKRLLSISQRISRSFCQDSFKKKGDAEENVYMRREDARLLEQIRKNKEQERYKKYQETKKKISNKSRNRTAENEMERKNK